MCRNLTHLHIEHAHIKKSIHSLRYIYKKKYCKNRITMHGYMKFYSESICY